MENKKSILVVSIIALVALVLIVIFTVMQLRSGGIIGSADSKDIVKTFEKYYKSKDKKVIFYASSECSWCKLEQPILDTIASDYDIDYYYVDTSKLSTSQRLKIMKNLEIAEHATPITVIVQDGKVIDKKEGFTPSDEYVEFFKANGLAPDDAVYSGEKNITFIDYSKYEALLKDKDIHIVVVGQTTCSHCIAFKPAINSVAGEYNVTINYLNLTNMTEEEYESFKESLNKIGFDDPDYVSKGSFGTPTTLVIKNGKQVSNHVGEMTTYRFTEYLKSLNLISE